MRKYEFDAISTREADQMAKMLMSERNAIRDLQHVSGLILYGLLIVLSVVVSLCILVNFNPDVIQGKFTALRKLIILTAMIFPALHFLNRSFSWKSGIIALAILLTQVALIFSLGWLYP